MRDLLWKHFFSVVNKEILDWEKMAQKFEKKLCNLKNQRICRIHSNYKRYK